MNKFLNTLIWCIFLLSSVIAQAQTDTAEVWSLETCVQYAWENSPQIKQNHLSIRQASLQYKQAKWAQWPTLNGSIRHGFNLGRSIDLTSYEFVNQATQSTNISLNINAPIYNGGQVRNTIKQTAIDQQAVSRDLEQTKNDLALSIAQAYLAIVLAEENLDVLQTQYNLTNNQLEQTLKLIDAGALPEANRYDLDAQLARDEEAILIGKNAILLAYLNLKLLLNIDPSKEIQVERMEVNVPEDIELWTLDQIYDEAVVNYPSIVAARLREESAQVGVKIAKGALQPSIALYGVLATNYSSVGQRFTGDTLTVNQSFSGDLGGVPFTLDIPTQIPERETSPFFTQLGSNFYQNVGVSVQIPILNGMRNKINIERAELAVETAKLTTSQQELQLKSDIQRALTDAQAASLRLAAAEKTLFSTEKSLENTKKRYDLKIVNAFELTSAQNMLVIAQQNVVQAKYDLVFKLKVLDFYRGEIIKFD